MKVSPCVLWGMPNHLGRPFLRIGNQQAIVQANRLVTESGKMELKEFISATLQVIIEGVKEAQEMALENDAIINPSSTRTANDGDIDKIVTRTIHRVERITFDVAVTATEGTVTKGGAGISVGILKLGADGKSNAETQSLSRIKFKVGIKLPSQSG